MYQWKTSSAIHAASILPGTCLSISQLIRIERHRGTSYSAPHGPHYEQNTPRLGHGVIGGPAWTFVQDDQDLPPFGVPATNVTLQANLTTLQIPDPGSSRRLLHLARHSRLAQFRCSRSEASSSISKMQRRHITQSAGPLPPNPRGASKKSLSTQTGSSPSRIPQIVPNKLPPGFKAPTKSVKRADDAFRTMDHGETPRAWPMSSEERKAEAKRKEEARILKEAEAEQARAAQEAAVRWHRQEQLRLEAEAVKRANALAVEQKNQEVRERWMAKVSAYAVGLKRVASQLDTIRSQIEKLLEQCEETRRKLWEQNAKTAERAFDKIARTKDGYAKIVATCSESSTMLCTAILDFCEAVGKDVYGERYAGLVPQRKSFLPRYMLAEMDTPERTANLCTIFWMYARLINFQEDMGLEAHLWRHLYAARVAHELHPEAFSYRPRLAVSYCNIQRFGSGSQKFYEDYKFWDDHTEFVSPQLSTRSQRERCGPDLYARNKRRQYLAFALKDMATDTQRDFSQMLDRGNFVLGSPATDCKRQQQIALRKPFTLVREMFNQIEQDVAGFGLLLIEDHPRRKKINDFVNDMKNERRKIQDTLRSYLGELDALTYWNWLATEHNVPRRRMSLLRNSQPTEIEADVPKTDSVLPFKQIEGPDQAWRYTDFRGPNGQQVVVDYCVSHEFAERTARLFTKSRVIGIDLWGGRRFANVEDAVREGNNAKRCVPMIAVANEDRIALFHIAAMNFDFYAHQVPTLIRVLEDSTICKVGENVRAFRQRLLVYMGVNMKGAIDLDSASALPSRSPNSNSIIDPCPALTKTSSLLDGYPLEPRTTTSLSDQLLKQFGQSLHDNTINPGDLQMPRNVSPQLLQRKKVLAAHVCFC